jgi:hypothetical protein
VTQKILYKLHLEKTFTHFKFYFKDKVEKLQFLRKIKNFNSKMKKQEQEGIEQNAAGRSTPGTKNVSFLDILELGMSLP